MYMVSALQSTSGAMKTAMKSSQESADKRPSSCTVLCTLQPNPDKVYGGTPLVVNLYPHCLGLEVDLCSRLEALEVEVETIKSIVASKEQKQNQEHREIQAVTTVKRQEVRMQMSVDAKRHWHLVTLEDLMIIIVMMAENSQPGQLVDDARIASKEARPSASDHDKDSTPYIDTQQILTKRDASKAIQSGSFVSPPDDTIMHKQLEQQIPDSDVKNAGLSHAANVSTSARKGITLAGTRQISLRGQCQQWQQNSQGPRCHSKESEKQGA